jgi:hypothetical protein
MRTHERQMRRLSLEELIKPSALYDILNSRRKISKCQDGDNTKNGLPVISYEIYPILQVRDSGMDGDRDGSTDSNDYNTKYLYFVSQKIYGHCLIRRLTARKW